MISLTIVSDANGSTRSENCENAIIEASRVHVAVLDLEAEAEGINTRVCVCGSIILLISSVARGVPYRENDYIAHQHEGGRNATRPL